MFDAARVAQLKALAPHGAGTRIRTGRQYSEGIRKLLKTGN